MMVGDALQKVLDFWPTLRVNLSDIEQGNDLLDEKIAGYQQLLPQVEDVLWQSYSEKGLIYYQALCREMEQLIATQLDTRHEFVLVVPIADRPQHLNSCLKSVFRLCETYGYGGKVDGFFSRINVIVADDSQQHSNIVEHQEIINTWHQRGLRIEYFGLDEQIVIVEQLSEKQKIDFVDIIGAVKVDDFSHKGASIMRNITYLRLRQLVNPKVLFYFFDSDQEFQVTVSDNGQFRTDYALNYFYHLDRIFSDSSVQILTGKVVGDPPVSPSVMANNFVDDVLAFIQKMPSNVGIQSCQFHQDKKPYIDDAAYHDMREMFGFTANNDVYDYACPIQGEHMNLQCLEDFSKKLNQFFYGEHATRKTYYKYENIQQHVKLARTIYTGNYIFKPEVLSFFIPFASLKLRMAGPVLGRLIQASLGAGFVSANLPMLHKRTLDTTGRSEFRSGVQERDQLVDLSDEFVRQYYGDLMLFSIVDLTEKGFIDKDFSSDFILALLISKDTMLMSKYQEKQGKIKDKIKQMQVILSTKKDWPSSISETFQVFMDNMTNNFSPESTGFQTIQDKAHKADMLESILIGIMGYKRARKHWQDFLKLESLTESR